ncbi:hypothetical protein ACFYOT_37625 [Saccharothrix saharensis]|uniref:hypothetical protein n=1 Tax=Saccharothrix saharensis TaxID=571190 RepID=UPI0036C873C8
MSDPNRPPHADPDPPADRTPTPPADTGHDTAAPPTPGDQTTGQTTAPPTPGGQTTAQPAAPPAPGVPSAAQPAAAVPAAPDPGHHSPPAGRATIGRVVRHRATQLVAVGLLGLVLGGGIVALADRDHHPRYGVGADRHGHPRFDERGDRGHRGERGPDRVPGRDFER